MAAGHDFSVFGEVSPELYKQNPFRVSGLAVDATSRDIRRRSEQLRVMERLGTDADALSSAAHGWVLPLSEQPGATAILEAIQRLRDPAQRLAAEFFWFLPASWPAAPAAPAAPASPAAPAASAAGDGSDEAMAALRSGDLDTAMSVWERLGSGTGPQASIAVHNAAVLAHAQALDFGGINPAVQQIVQQLWNSAYAHWAAVSADDTFWALVQARIREMADPRVGPEAAREMREVLPSVLLSISASMAARLARKGLADAAVHIRLMRGSGFDAATIDSLLRREAEPDMAAIRSIGESTERATESDPAQGAKAALRLLDQTAPLIAALGHILPSDHVVVKGIRDEVASAAMSCAAQYVNKTGELEPARDVLERAAPVAATETIRARIRDNLNTVRTLMKDEAEARRIAHLVTTCWFDKANPAVGECAYPQKMYGDVNRQPTAGGVRVTWRKVTISVPRCPDCYRAHLSRQRTTRLTGRLVSLLLLPVLTVLMFVMGLGEVGAFLTLADLMIIPMTLWRVSKFTGVPRAQHNTVRDFDPIKELLGSGWQLGEKPTTR